MHLIRRSLAVLVAASLLTAAPVGAASDKQLVAVRGTSGYRVAANSDFRRVVSRQLLADDNIAVTEAASNAFVVLPDSTEVALGAATSVQVGAFNDPLSSTPTTLTLRNGALRFNVKHPAGGTANYVFKTATSQIAVRGTIALYKSDQNGDVISCLQCQPGDAVATIDGKTYPLVSGQTLLVSPAHAVTTANGEAAPAQAFAGTGLSTSATSAVAFTAEVQSAAAAANAAAAAAHAATVGAIAGGAAIAGAAAAVISNNTVKTSATPAPTETGSAQLSGSARAAAATPAPKSPH
jgi:hypothetical protein